MEGADRRRARPCLRGVVWQRAGSRRVELRCRGHARLPGCPLQAPHGAVARRCHGARRGERRGERRSLENAPGWCRGLPQEPSPRPFPAPPPRVRGENARLTQQKQTIEEELVAVVEWPGESRASPGRGSLRRRSTPAVVEQSGDRLSAPDCDHGQARSRLRPRSAVLRRREGVGPERLSRPVGGQPGIRGFASSAEELRTGRGTFSGHAAEALRERIGSSADPQDQRGRIRTPRQRGCHRGDGFQAWIESLGSRKPAPKNPSGSLWAMGAPPPVLASR